MTSTRHCMQDPRAYVAGSLQQLTHRVESRHSAWCGWAHFLGGLGPQCVLHASPFGDAYVALVEHRAPGSFSRPGRPFHLACMHAPAIQNAGTDFFGRSLSNPPMYMPTKQLTRHKLQISMDEIPFRDIDGYAAF